MWFGVITLFPDWFESFKRYGVVGRVLDETRRNVSAKSNRPQVHLVCFNPRDHAVGKHQSVDDCPYGGGPGMVMKLEPLLSALASARQSADAFFQDLGYLGSVKPKVILFSPQGKPLVQSDFENLSRHLTVDRSVAPCLEPLILVSGRYEGIDERFIELAVDLEYSIGDYVLTGGELPAMVFLDALIRLMPGVLGSLDSVTVESFGSGQLLEHPHYTRPADYKGLKVPDILLSGDHKRIESWRNEARRQRTLERRPDLLFENLTQKK